MNFKGDSASWYVLEGTNTELDSSPELAARVRWVGGGQLQETMFYLIRQCLSFTSDL